MYALGSNSNNQLGLLHVEDVSTPQRCWFEDNDCRSVHAANIRVDYLPLTSEEFIRSTASGGNHTLILTSNGTVWATGNNKNGQLGTQGFREVSNEDQDQDEVQSHGWQRLNWTGPGACNITHIAANWETSYFVVNQEAVYSCGMNSKGELGIGPDLAFSRKLQKCFDISTQESPRTKITQLAACMNHAVLGLSLQSCIYGWGASRKGQIGEAAKALCGNIAWTPTKIQAHQVPRRILVGREFTYIQFEEGYMFLGDNKKLGFWQEAQHLRDEEEISVAAHIVYAGWTHIIVRQLATGHTQGFGRNKRGQILSNMPDLQLQKLALGSEHCLAQMNDGHVIAWGWGEHGNCGAEVDEKSNVQERYNIVFKATTEQKILGLGAGCATSFIWVHEPF